MDELVKAFQKFLMRDLTFITGGSAVLLSFLIAFDHAPRETTPIIWYLVGALFAYAIGYAIQEVSVLMHLVRTKAGIAPSAFEVWLYERFEHRGLTKQPYVPEDYEKAKKVLFMETTPERPRADHERTESLKQLGNTLGPCMLVAGVIQGCRCLCLQQTGFLFALTLAAMLLGVILICCGRLKVTQQAQYVFQLQRNYEEHGGPNPVETKK